MFPFNWTLNQSCLLKYDSIILPWDIMAVLSKFKVEKLRKWKKWFYKNVSKVKFCFETGAYQQNEQLLQGRKACKSDIMSARLMESNDNQNHNSI